MNGQREGSVIVPILLAALVFAVTIGFVQQASSIKKLDKTDRIACEFLTADANTRAKQATNSTHVVAAQQRYQASIDRLVRLFIHPRPRTAEQQQTVSILTAYLTAQSDVLTAQINTTSANLVLTRGLVDRGRELAKQLKC